MKNAKFIFITVIFAVFLFAGCEKDSAVLPEAQVNRIISREETLPDDIKKCLPETDVSPPIIHTDEFEAPVPLPGPINTVGGEDSPFILPDGKTMYFFFTPDVRVPPNEQLTDGVTGIWVSYKDDAGVWSPPERVWLEDPGKLSLDGAPFVRDDEMWFASAREGFTGMNIFTARNDNSGWTDWKWVGERLGKELRVGELHIWQNELYYHSDLEGGKGGFDIWMTKYENGSWSDAQNIEILNTPELDGYPYVSSDGGEMWFTRNLQGSPAIFRSYRIEDKWEEPELIVSQFAGEPTLDDSGNLYFTHHYFENSEMIEADIYVAYKKTESEYD